MATNEEIHKWIRLYDSLTMQFEKIEERCKRQTAEIEKLKEGLNNCEFALEINKNTFTKIINEESRKQKELVDLVNKQKAKLKELGFNGELG